MALSLVTLLVGATLLLPAAPAQVAEPSVPGLSPEVAALPATSRDLDSAQQRLSTAQSTLERARSELDQTTADAAANSAESTATTALMARRQLQLTKVDGQLAAQRAALRSIATEWFVAGTADRRSLDPSLAPKELQELRRQAVLGDAAATSVSAAVGFQSLQRGDVVRDIDQLQHQDQQLRVQMGELQERTDRLTESVAASTAEVAAAQTAVTSARLNATVDGVDMSTVALDAYWRAQQSLARTLPACRASWWMLAGIGRTESRHGTYLGSDIAADGRVEPPILGPPLDGTNGFATVADSDAGLLDGDAGFDRAVGPMQFLPSTWRTVGRDGNGDGRSDPDNIYDAALGAGVYLCRSGDLSSEEVLRRAYITYNRSQTYVDAVIGYAHAYRDALALPSAT